MKTGARTLLRVPVSDSQMSLNRKKANVIY